MLDKTDIRDPRNGYFDVCYSPDDGGWYADLLFTVVFRETPIFDSSDQAEQWARHNGGKHRLR